jgi:hypothetical protein
LRDATEKSIAPPGYTPNGSLRSERLDEADLSGDELGDVEVRRSPTSTSQRSKKGLFMKIRRFAYPGKPKTDIERTEDQRRRVFKIPAKVRDRRHFITDELTELTKTFNDMSDELMLQYERLEQKVAERTQELEISKVRFSSPHFLIPTRLSLATFCILSHHDLWRTASLITLLESCGGCEREQNFVHCKYIPRAENTAERHSRNVCGLHG